MIKIVDIKISNVKSIQNALKKVGIDSQIIDDPNLIHDVSGLVLPGVGNFDEAMTKLKNGNWIDPLNYSVLRKKIPVLGICLGMQIMSNSSEEGKLNGFGWFDAKVKKMSNLDTNNEKIPLPHMRWSNIEIHKNDCLFLDKKELMRFYFVHGYHMVCNDINNIIATADYGKKFTAAISKENIFGVQFHPEKSHSFGQTILKRFSTICR
jgi:glutamine amidotransferase